MVAIKRSILDHLRIEDNRLYLDGVDLLRIAEEYGTPTIIFSESRIRENARNVLEAFRNHFSNSYVYYALKANSILSIIKIVREEGLRCEVASYGELVKALRAGFKPSEVVFNGPGKTVKEVELAVKLGVHCVNVDSFYELKLLNAVAERLNKRIGVSLRVVPEVSAPILQTGVSSSKFGFEAGEIVKAYRLALSLKGVEVKGLHAHFGSQISNINTWIYASRVLVSIANRLYDELNLKLEHINMGGGLPVDYTRSLIVMDREVPEYLKASFSEDDVARIIAESIKDLKFNTNLYIEPGRRIIADTGILLTRIVNFKERSFNERWLIVDAGFNILLSARVLQWYYPMLSVSRISERHDSPFRVGGPLCDAHDVYHDLEGEGRNECKLPRYRLLPRSSSPGDVLAMLHVGAYGPEVMMNFNGMLRPPIVMVFRNGNVKTIRRGDNVDDLIAYEEV